MSIEHMVKLHDPVSGKYTDHRLVTMIIEERHDSGTPRLLRLVLPDEMVVVADGQRIDVITAIVPEIVMHDL